LLAPGEPTWIGADGQRLGWAVSDLLFLYEPGNSVVEAIRLPGLVDAVAPGPEHWSVATELGVFRVDPELASIDSELPLVLEPGEQLWVGLDLAVQSGRRHQAWRLVDGRAWLLPTHLLDVPCLRPWSAGLGTLWSRGNTLGRGRETIGSFDGLSVGMAGPGGAWLAQTAAGLRGSCGTGEPWNFGALELENAVFSPDGRWAALPGALLDLRTGGRQPAPSGLPVGCVDGQWLYLLKGRLVALVPGDNLPFSRLWREEEPWTAFFRQVNLSHAGNGLTGPGGALWDLSQGQPLRTGLPPWVAWDGQRLGWMDAEQIGLLEGPRQPHGLLAGSDRLDRLAWEKEGLEGRSLDGERVLWSPEGGLRRGRAWQRRPTPLKRDPAFPLPIAGRHQDLAWTVTGMLLRRREIG
ncbi:MAG TPA: hypothetical protein PLA94_22820, partial [Myxococcota bacterium]|nr:hypothetical protein [Myxococcota bacterium]